MKIETKCPICEDPMLLEADESAGQEIIDKLALCVRCRKCSQPPTKHEWPRPGTIDTRDNQPPRKPYAD